MATSMSCHPLFNISSPMLCTKDMLNTYCATKWTLRDMSEVIEPQRYESMSLNF